MAWLELGLTERPDAVQNATNLALRIAKQAEQPLPQGMSIIQVYEEAEQELLILGEPGAGKSTELLRLAEHLVTQAEQDETVLLPVILPLSSWAVKRGKLAEWMEEQIAQIYDIPRNVSQQWVEGEQILPLLDGLDEMEETARSVCISAINIYHHAHLTPLVVCSRTAEYESADNTQHLQLQSAVVLRPLTREQVYAVLDQASEAVEGLQAALYAQPVLEELATSPLMLSVLMLAYQGKTVRTSLFNKTNLEQQIWTDYVQRMMERKQSNRVMRYSLDQTRSRLSWLAQQMHIHNQTIFYAEQLQVDWLDNRLRQAYTWLALRFPAIIIGIIVTRFVGFFLPEPPTTDLASLYHAMTLGGFLGGWLSSSLDRQAVSLVGKKRSSYVLIARLGSSLILAMLFGAIFGLDLNMNRSDPFFYTPSDWLCDSIIYGIGFGVSGWIISWLFAYIPGSSDPSQSKAIHHHIVSFRWLANIHLRRAIGVAFIWGTVFGLSDALHYAVKYRPNVNLSFLSLGGLGPMLGDAMSPALGNALTFGFICKKRSVSCSGTHMGVFSITDT